MASNDHSDKKSPLTVGKALGLFAKRISTVVSEVSDSVSESVATTEPIRSALQQARQARFVGDFGESLTVLTDSIDKHGEHEALTRARDLASVHQWFIQGSSGPDKTSPNPGTSTQDLPTSSESPNNSKSARPSPATEPLLDAIVSINRYDAEQALTTLRRTSRFQDKLLPSERDEYLFWVRSLTALAYYTRGDTHRAIRELYKARSAFPTESGDAVSDAFVRHGSKWLIAQDRLQECETWLNDFRNQRAKKQANTDTDTDGESTQPPVAWTSDELVALAWMTAASGDRRAALVLLENHEWDASQARTRARVHLCLGQFDEALGVLKSLLDHSPEDLSLRRLRCICRFRTLETKLDTTDTTDQAVPVGGTSLSLPDVFQDYCDVIRRSPQRRRAQYTQELALQVLAFQWWGDTTSKVLRQAKVESDVVSPELALACTLIDLGSPETLERDFVAGPPTVWKKPADLPLPHGPDEVSPVRDVTYRARIFDSTEQQVLAAYFLKHDRSNEGNGGRGDQRSAERALVQALTENPHNRTALGQLTKLRGPTDITRLEERLQATTDILGRVPDDILGHPAPEISTALKQVIASRERLARPLTVAVMGEFSSGKSTFVNALLGQSVAPMGVLPTTSTINVFRPGATGGARVHRRDGEIQTVRADNIHAFLEGIDDEQAQQITYLEIERKGTQLGETVVVDTPGLNALDPHHERVAREFLAEADAIIWIFSATKGVTASESKMLDELRGSGRRVLGILNKKDTLDEDELEQLQTYLREQLSGKVVDIVPLSADKCLEWRASNGVSDDADSPPSRNSATADVDPMQPVTTVLEREFFSRARELKRELTEQQLITAIDSAIIQLAEICSHLEADAVQGSHAPGSSSRSLLDAFADRLLASLGQTDEALARECLGTGTVSVESGLKSPIDQADIAYLDSVFCEQCQHAVQSEIQNLHTKDEDFVFSQLLTNEFLPWANGYISAIGTRGTMEMMLTRVGDTVTTGEANLQAALRAEIRDVFADWKTQLLQLWRQLDLARSQSNRDQVRAPRAEALRLQATFIAPLRAMQGQDERSS